MIQTRKSMASVVAAVFVAASMIWAANAEEYFVGNTSGWVVPHGHKDYFNHWAAQHKFHEGDTLVFNFVKGMHDVAKVSKAGYEACDGKEATETIKDGPAKVKLHSSGEHYFICTLHDHCKNGQRLAVNVIASSHSHKTSSRKMSPAPSSEATPSEAPTPGSEDSPSEAPTPGSEGSPSEAPSPGSEGSPSEAPGPGSEGSPSEAPGPETESEDSPSPESEDSPSPGSEDSPSEAPSPGSEKSPSPTPGTEGSPSKARAPGSEGSPSEAPSPGSEGSHSKAPSPKGEKKSESHHHHHSRK